MYSKIISHIFFLTLTCTVLSPFIGGSTLYFYVLFPLLDPEYFKYLGRVIKPRDGMIFFIFVVASGAAASSLGLPARILSIAVVVSYSFFAYDRKQFYLYGYMIFNVVWGLFQFAFSYVDPGMAYTIGPTNISTLIWGPFAGPSFTNFYEIFLLKRVSGLSREAGFFASLLATTFAIAIFDRNLDGRRKWLYVFLAAGFMISLSKMSLVIVLMIPVFFFRRALSKVNLGLFTVLFLLIVGNLLNTFYYEKGKEQNIENISITHRTSGYVFLMDLDPMDLLLGTPNDVLHQKYRDNELVSMLTQHVGATFDFPGWAGVAIQSGLVALMIGLAYMGLLGFNGFYMAVVTLLCINISPVAITASTSMAWFAALLAIREQRRRAVVTRDSPLRELELARERLKLAAATRESAFADGGAVSPPLER